jgi:hypothetical protein
VATPVRSDHPESDGSRSTQLELAGLRVNCEQNSLLYLVRRTTLLDVDSVGRRSSG